MSLVMLPVTAMCVLAGSVVLSHRTIAERATAVDQGVGRLSDLVELDDAIHDQQRVETFNVRFLQLGTTIAAATEFVGYDWTVEVVPARAKADRAIASLGNHSPVDADALHALYAGIDDGAIGPLEASHRIERFNAAVEQALTSGLDRIELGGNQASLVAKVKSLRAATQLIDVAASQVVDLSAAWFPSPGATPAAVGVATAHVTEGSDAYAAAVDRIRVLGVKPVIARLDRMQATTEVQLFIQALAGTPAGMPVLDGAPDRAKIAATFRGAFAREALLDALVATATTAVRAEARRIAAAERADFVGWTAAVLVLAAASIAVALWLARSISRPLKKLAGYAKEINEGRLDTVPSSRRKRGPRETSVAFDVFTDMVHNLQLLDAKANALAQCDFDDPVLHQPLPGRLGRSLESSVAVLSGSILERDRLQSHLAHQATHDSLTDIWNRPAAITAIEAAMHRVGRTGTSVAVLFVDLNDFKAINDTFGHKAGDEVLRQVATRMATMLRGGDVVARLGGDEFVIVAEGITDIQDATDLAKRIVDTISQPIDIANHRFRVEAAIGIALTLDGPEEPLQLLARADAAMYRAKYHEGSAIEIFDAGLQRQLVERLEVEAALAAALAEPTGGGLQLHYQPVLDAATTALVGTEALVRWDRPGLGLLPPDSFIPIAETSGLIIDLDRWVLAQATRQLVEWSAIPELADVPVAVNISGRHLLSGKLADHIRAVLDDSGIDSARLHIEITETVLLSDLVAAASELDAVRALGVRVAIDDFGTGYTSLAHLQQLPIDTIKIDRSFVSQLNARRGYALVRMVTDLGHAFDIEVIAEGVETSEEMLALQAMGADHLQGYLLSRPLEPAALVRWARDRGAVDVRGS